MKASCCRLAEIAQQVSHTIDARQSGQSSSNVLWDMLKNTIGWGLALALTCLTAVPACAQDQPVDLKFVEVGGQTVLKLRAAENGTWQLDRTHSFALDKVELKELGGVPGLYQMRVEAKAPGIVVVAFTQAHPDKSVDTAVFGIKVESAGPTALTTDPGSTIAVNLLGTPGAGYAWTLNNKESSGGDLVKIEDLGWNDITVPGIAKRLEGGPAVRRYAVKALRTGHAKLVFDYHRPWEQKPPLRQKIIELTIED